MWNTVGLLVLLATGAAASQISSNFHTETGFADKLCFPEFRSATWNVSPARSDVDCVARCSLKPGCKGVFYNPLNNTCSCGSHVFEDTDYCQEDQGSVYMTVDTVPYQGACDGTIPCTADNMVCWDRKCVCKPGYSLWPSRTACLADCSEVGTTLGTTFQVYRRRLMSMSNLATYQRISYATCRRHCLAWAGQKQCTGFEHNPRRDCGLNAATPLTNPNKFRTTSIKSYYFRNCL